MKGKALGLMVFVALLAAAIGCSQIARTQTTVAAKAVASAASASPQGSAGMVVHKDPASGRFIPAPQATEQPLSKEAATAMNMSQEGLAEVPAPGGGFMVDLRGRFQQAMTATISANGTPTVECGQHERREKE